MIDDANDPGYFGIIYHDILFHKELSDKAKLLYVALTSLAKSKGYAWPTNAYLANLFGISIDAVNENLGKLQEHGFIFREAYNEGFSRKRKIWVARDKIKEFLRIGENAYIEMGENAYSEMGENAYSSIYNNINEKDNPPTPQRGKEEGIAYADPTRYASSTDARFKKINPEDFEFLQSPHLVDKFSDTEKMQLMRYPEIKVREAIGWALEQSNTRSLMGRVVDAIKHERRPEKAASRVFSKAEIHAWVDWLNEKMKMARKKERYSIENEIFNGYVYDFEDVATEKGFLVKSVPCSVPAVFLYDPQSRKNVEEHMKMIIGRKHET